MANKSELGYVTRHHEYDGHNGPEIDLGLGTSPIGPAPELATLLAQRNPIEVLAYYPDPLHQETRSRIVEGIGLKDIDYHSIVLDGNGSYGAGDEITRFLKIRGYHTIIATCYSFPNASQWAIRHGLNYQPIVGETLDPLTSLQTILKLNRENLESTIVYLDYPNNPFGLAEPELTRAVIKHAARNGAIPLVDPAFGEVLGNEFTQIIQFALNQGGIVLASFSKTQGLPGLRSGYAILPKGLTQNGYSNGERLVFGLNSEAEFIYQLLFSPQDNGTTLAKVHTSRVAEYNRVTNQKLIFALTSLGLTVGPTDLRTPIQVVISPKFPDFYQRLLNEGVVTESLADYQITLGENPGFGHSAVRMLTPRPQEFKEVLKRIKHALE